MAAVQEGAIRPQPSLRERIGGAFTGAKKAVLPALAVTTLGSAALDAGCAPGAAPQEHSADLPLVVKQGDPAQAAQHDITVSPTPIPILGSNPVETPTPGGAEPASNTGLGTDAKPAEAPAPEAKLSKEQAIEKINKLIDEVKNPDSQLVDKYGITPDKLKSNGDLILGGAPDRKVPGLNDVKVTIEEGDLILARTQLLDVFDNWLWGRLIPIGPGKIAAVVLTDEEKKQADPNNEIFGRNPQKAPAFSPIRKAVGLDVSQTIGQLPKN